MFVYGLRVLGRLVRPRWHWLAALAILLFLSSMHVCRVPSRVAMEFLAIKDMDAIVKAQRSFYRLPGNSSYAGTLQELQDAGVILPVDWERRPYRYKIVLISNGLGFALTGTPRRHGDAVMRTFYVDHTGTIRQSYDILHPAGPDSEELR